MGLLNVRRQSDWTWVTSAGFSVGRSLPRAGFAAVTGGGWITVSHTTIGHQNLNYANASLTFGLSTPAITSGSVSDQDMDSGGVIWVLDGCPSDELAPGDFIGATLALTIDASFITKSPGSTSRSVTVMLFGIPNAGSKLEKEIVSGAAQIVLYAASPAAWAIAPRISDYFASSAKGCFVFWGDSLGSSISFDMGPQVGFMWTDGRLTDDMIKLNSLTSPQTTYRIIENIREKPYTQTAKEAPDPLVLPAAALFAFDSAGLLPSSIQLLTQLKSWFEVNARLGYNGKQRVFLVEGYASRDAPNRESHDLRLSFNRANAIRAWILQSTRLRPDQVQHFGYGQEYPVAPNTTRENREKNRRVRIVVKDQ